MKYLIGESPHTPCCGEFMLFSLSMPWYMKEEIKACAFTTIACGYVKKFI